MVCRKGDPSHKVRVVVCKHSPGGSGSVRSNDNDDNLVGEGNVKEKAHDEVK